LAGNSPVVSGNGGTGAQGVLYSLTPHTKSLWTYKILHNFDLVDGDGAPLSPLTIINHELYGTSSIGHVGGPGGAVWKFSRPSKARAPWKKTLLYSFQGSTDGAGPSGQLLPGPDGVLYGMTFSGGSANCGAVYKLKPPASGKGSWTKTVLHDFAGQPDGCNPNNFGLAANADGTLFGTTVGGGANNAGTIFTLKP